MNVWIATLCAGLAVPAVFIAIVLYVAKHQK